MAGSCAWCIGVLPKSCSLNFFREREREREKEKGTEDAALQ